MAGDACHTSESKTKKSGNFLGALPTVEPTGIRCRRGSTCKDHQGKLRVKQITTTHKNSLSPETGGEREGVAGHSFGSPGRGVIMLVAGGRDDGPDGGTPGPARLDSQTQFRLPVRSHLGDLFINWLPLHHKSGNRLY
jgi:hypothetical protein